MEKIVLKGDISSSGKLAELINVLFPECEVQFLEQGLDKHAEPKESLALKVYR